MTSIDEANPYTCQNAQQSMILSLLGAVPSGATVLLDRLTSPLLPLMAAELRSDRSYRVCDPAPEALALAERLIPSSVKNVTLKPAAALDTQARSLRQRSTGAVVSDVALELLMEADEDIFERYFRPISKCLTAKGFIAQYINKPEETAAPLERTFLRIFPNVYAVDMTGGMLLIGARSPIDLERLQANDILMRARPLEIIRRSSPPITLQEIRRDMIRKAGSAKDDTLISGKISRSAIGDREFDLSADMRAE